METTSTNIETMRAEAEWQRAGAYSVRIQGMNRKYHISLREEFDEHDGNGTKYIVLLHDGYPIATCRLYKLTDEIATIGRVVVLPEYQGQGLGKRTVLEAEKWIKELGYHSIEIESRTTAIDFYHKLGYTDIDNVIIKNGVFECVRMSKVF